MGILEKCVPADHLAPHAAAPPEEWSAAGSRRSRPRWPRPRKTRCFREAEQPANKSDSSPARTQATEYHLGQLKAKLAKLRTELQAPPKVRSQGGACSVRSGPALKPGLRRTPKAPGRALTCRSTATGAAPSLVRTWTAVCGPPSAAAAADWAGGPRLPVGGQVHAADRADRHQVGGCGLRVHHADVHPRRHPLQRGQDPAAGPAGHHRGRRRGQGCVPGHPLGQDWCTSSCSTQSRASSPARGWLSAHEG